MLPAGRTTDPTFTLTTFEVTPHDVDGLLDELWHFQAAFHDCFARSESRAHSPLGAAAQSSGLSGA